jgi:hypothetical protein
MGHSQGEVEEDSRGGHSAVGLVAGLAAPGKSSERMWAGGGCTLDVGMVAASVHLAEVIMVGMLGSLGVGVSGNPQMETCWIYHVD